MIAQALSELRLAGVDGPYCVLLSADVYTEVSETTAHGYPIREHLNRLVDGDIIWAPAIDGAFVLSTRGGDFDLQLGTDVSIGYLSHDADTVQLYLQETLTFLLLHRRGVGRAERLRPCPGVERAATERAASRSASSAVGQFIAGLGMLPVEANQFTQGCPVGSVGERSQSKCGVVRHHEHDRAGRLLLVWRFGHNILHRCPLAALRLPTLRQLEATGCQS